MNRDTRAIVVCLELLVRKSVVSRLEPRGVIWGGWRPSPPRKKKKERKIEKREKKEERKKGTMNNVKLLHIKCCFFQFFNSPVAFKIEIKFGPPKKKLKWRSCLNQGPPALRQAFDLTAICPPTCLYKERFSSLNYRFTNSQLQVYASYCIQSLFNKYRDHWALWLNIAICWAWILFITCSNVLLKYIWL